MCTSISSLSSSLSSLFKDITEVFTGDNEPVDNAPKKIYAPTTTQSNNPTAIATQSTLTPHTESKAQRAKRRGLSGLRINLAKSDNTGLNIPQA